MMDHICRKVMICDADVTVLLHPAHGITFLQHYCSKKTSQNGNFRKGRLFFIKSETLCCMNTALRGAGMMHSIIPAPNNQLYTSVISAQIKMSSLFTVWEQRFEKSWGNYRGQSL